MLSGSTTVNCNDYLSMLATLPIDELAFGNAREHAVECRDCDRITRVVAERERNIRLAYDTLHSPMSVEQTAFQAIEASRRRRIGRYYEGAFVLAMAASVMYLVTARRTVTRAPVPAATETFRLGCLSQEQAADVLAPERSQTTSISFPPRPARIVTVSGTVDDVRRAREALDEAKGSQCVAPATPPKTP
jgi:hypothetical protein